ncbi:hypothetical protein F5Y15DRAFT_83347 [Xylariaceae sp. FL0016]|nr:hypothetical protein F5Y15DRAFT_83347 [Xylariaceae sp. FL0016]
MSKPPSGPKQPLSRLLPRSINRGAAPTTLPKAAYPLDGRKITTKRVIFTAAFAAVTVVGAIYGAGLKTQQEYKAEKKEIMAITPEDRIRGLEERRAALMRQKEPLERKLETLRERIGTPQEKR